MQKVSVRFGIRLSWPIANAAIFVIKLTSVEADRLIGAVRDLRSILRLSGNEKIADAIVCEKRE